MQGFGDRVSTAAGLVAVGNTVIHRHARRAEIIEALIVYAMSQRRTGVGYLARTLMAQFEGLKLDMGGNYLRWFLRKYIDPAIYLEPQSGAMIGEATWLQWRMLLQQGTLAQEAYDSAMKACREGAITIRTRAKLIRLASDAIGDFERSLFRLGIARELGGTYSRVTLAEKSAPESAR